MSAEVAESPAAPARGVVVLATFLTPVVLCVSAANNIIIRNLGEISYARETLAVFGAAFAVMGVCGAAFAVLSVRHRAFVFCTRLWCAIGLAVLAFDATAGLTASLVQDFSLVAALDVTTLCLVLLLCFRPVFPVFIRLCAAAAAALLCAGVSIHWIGVSQYRAGLRAATAAAAAEGPQSETAVSSWRRPNVYHILLDGFQSDAFTLLRHADPNVLPDFQHFGEFFAGYPTTQWSVPHMLNGREYREGEAFAVWRNRPLAAGLWADLARGDIRVELYPLWEAMCPQFPATCAPLHGDVHASPTAVTVDLWFLHVLPRSVRWVVNHGWQGMAATDMGTRGTEDAPQFLLTEGMGLVAPGRHAPFAIGQAIRSRDLFRDTIAREAQRPATGQYMFWHLLVPHEPYSLDETCAPLDVAAPIEIDYYMAQAWCATRLIQELVDRLRQAHRLEDALIIVQSDHGMGGELADAFRDRYGAELDSLGVPWPDYVDVAMRRMEQRSRALLLVKMPRGQTVRNTELGAHMNDIAPSILRHFGLPVQAYPGIAIHDAVDPTREHLYYFGHKARGLFTRFTPAKGELVEYVRMGGRWEKRRVVHVEP